MDEKEIEQLQADYAALLVVEQQLRADLTSAQAVNADLNAALARNAARVWELRESEDAAQKALVVAQDLVRSMK